MEDTKIDYDALGVELLFEANQRPEPPMVSVHMITYGHEHFIVKAVSSVLEGTYDDYELIISDDSSPDRTREVLLEYLKNYRGAGQVRYLRQRKNGGINGCGHALVFRALSRGQLISTMDGDDFSCPDRLARTVELWKSLEPEPSIMVVNAYRYIDVEDRVDGFASPDYCPKGERIYYPPGDIFESPAPPFGSGTVMSRRYYNWLSQFKPIGRCMAGDALNVKRALMDRGEWFVNEPLLYYRVNAGSVTHKSVVLWTRDRLFRWKQLKQDAIQLAPNHKLDAEMEKKFDYWIERTQMALDLQTCAHWKWPFIWICYWWRYTNGAAINALKLRLKLIFLGDMNASLKTRY